MSLAVQTLDISPVGRVEGDLDVPVDIKDGVDLTNGECLTAPEVQLQPHAVRVIAGHVEIRIAT
jgi:hypothetical protein